MYWTYAVVAAALLVVSAVGALYLRVAPEQTTPGIAAQVFPTPVSAVELVRSNVTNPPVSVLPTLPDRPRRSSKRPPLAKGQSTTTVAQSELLASNNEITTEFIPIGYSGSPTVQDGGQLVRVEVPRSTMARFGLPVNMERYDERVKADLWLGADGFARAIRFVQ